MRLAKPNAVASMEVTNGLPFFSDFELDDSLQWQMSRSEKYCMINLLNTLKPDHAIEIGTYQGGSTQVISKFSKQVTTIDISDSPKNLLQDKFDNVSFVINESHKVLKDLFKEIEDKGDQLNFVLVDGDHTRLGVSRDLHAVLEYPHQNDVVVVLHDSFNPDCRKGMQEIDYSKYPQVSYVELDYVCGSFWTNDSYREMWGGLALVKIDGLKNGKRSDTAPVFQSYQKEFETCKAHSVHTIKDKLRFLIPIKKAVLKKLGRRHRTDRYYDFDTDHNAK